MKTRLMMAIAILAVFVIAGCSSNGNVVYEVQEGKKGKEPIEVGVFTVLSGEGAVYGESLKKGMDLAVDTINSEGGVLGRNITLIYEDTHLDGKAAVSAMKKFIEVNDMEIVISGEGSGATSAVAPLADETETLMMVAIASTPTLKEAGDYVFRVIPSDTYQGREIARIANENKYEDAAVIYVNDEYGVGMKNVFSQGFENVVYTHAFESGETDFRTAFTKIKKYEPDLIVVIAREEFPSIFKQKEELGIESAVITSEMFRDEKQVEASGEAAEGVFTPFFAETEDHVEFRPKFQERYDEEYTMFSDYGYDSVAVLGQAIETAGTTESSKVKDVLYNLEYYGATGKVKFDRYGEVMDKPFTIYQVQDGEIVELD